MSLAVCQAVMAFNGDYDALSRSAIRHMRALGKQYPDCGFGYSFYRWVTSEEEPEPYGSYGNGAAMRVSACGFAAGSVYEAMRLSNAVTRVSHDHPEGLKGAEAVAVAIYLAKTGASLSVIRAYIEQHYYALDFTLDDIRDRYGFDVTCQGSVPQAIEAFLESTDYEDAIRNAISIGGDSDTIAAMAGGIAEAYYGIPEDIRAAGLRYLDEQLTAIVNDFEQQYPPKRIVT